VEGFFGPKVFDTEQILGKISESHSSKLNWKFHIDTRIG
jgi:hypothetical protein